MVLGGASRPGRRDRTMARDMRVGDTVKHDSGWAARVTEIEGEILGNRVIYLEGHRDPFLECSLTRLPPRLARAAWIPGSWEVCRVEDLVAGDRVSFDEDALAALDNPSAEFGPEAINWGYVREDSRVVDFRAFGDPHSVWAYRIHFTSGDPVQAVAYGRLVREVRKA